MIHLQHGCGQLERFSSHVGDLFAGYFEYFRSQWSAISEKLDGKTTIERMPVGGYKLDSSKAIYI